MKTLDDLLTVNSESDLQNQSINQELDAENNKTVFFNDMEAFNDNVIDIEPTSVANDRLTETNTDPQPAHDDSFDILAQQK
jgi:hypothetical protein